MEKKLAPIFKGDDSSSEELDECPICFLNYPYVNTTRCCKQEICTECFLQIRSTRKPISCPFCNLNEFNVFYCRTKTQSDRISTQEAQKKIEEEQRKAEAAERDKLQERMKTRSERIQIERKQSSYSNAPIASLPNHYDLTVNPSAILDDPNISNEEKENFMIQEAIRLSLLDQASSV